MDLGPIPDPAIYMQAALNLAKLHGQVLDRSVALLQCPDTPEASNSVYSDGFCGMLVGLLSQGIRERNPLLSDLSKPTQQSNIYRYEAFSHNIKSWQILLPYQISQDASQRSMPNLPVNDLDQELISQTEVVLMITEPAQEINLARHVGHLEYAASLPGPPW